MTKLTNYISFDEKTNTFTISPGAATGDIQSIISAAKSGATVYFAEGQHVITKTLIVDRDDITLRGANEETTELHFALDKPGDGIIVSGGFKGTIGSISQDIHEGDTVIHLKDASKLQAGDVIRLQAANTDEYLADSVFDVVRDMSNTARNPLREAIVEVESVDGNKVTLKHAVAYDMGVDETIVKELDMLQDVVLSDFTVTNNLGGTDDDSFTNQQSAYEGTATIMVSLTQGVQIENISVIDAGSHAMEIRSSLEPVVTNYFADGSHNKGGGGNGYGIHIAEVFYGTFTELDLINVRHAFTFSSWSAEAYNNVQVNFTNRDINFHGSPDHSNTVMIDASSYDSGANTKLSIIWPLVKGAATHKHPYTDLDANTVTFTYAFGSKDHDVIHGNDEGVYLNGYWGDDTLYGGKGDDTLIGGEGDDLILGGEGNDVVETWHSWLYEDDYIDLGEGEGDTLLIYNDAYTFDATKVEDLYGIEILDVTSSLTGPSLILSDALVSDSDAYTFTVRYGDAGIKLLDLSDVKDGHWVSLEGTGNVQLADGDHSVILTDKTFGEISGGNGNDYMRVNGGNLVLRGGDGNDKFSVNDYQGLKIYGGNGNDILFFQGDSFDENVVFSGAAGYDQLFFAKGVDLDADDLSGVSSIEVLRFYEESSATLSDGLFSKTLRISGGHELIELDLDISQIDSSKSLLVLSNTKLFLSSDVGDSHTVRLSSRTNGEVHGGDGDETIIGHTADDNIYGGNGDDTLIGGYGLDHMSGGAGNDTFRVLYNEGNTDVIEDFNAIVGDQDVLDLSTLFDANGLGDLDTQTALDTGVLELRQTQSGVVVFLEGSEVVSLADVAVEDLNTSNVIV